MAEPRQGTRVHHQAFEWAAELLLAMREQSALDAEISALLAAFDPRDRENFFAAAVRDLDRGLGRFGNPATPPATCRDAAPANG